MRNSIVLLVLLLPSHRQESGLEEQPATFGEIGRGNRE
jgi:hypothetical protein